MAFVVDPVRVVANPAAPEFQHTFGAGKSQLFYIVRVVKTRADTVIDQFFFYDPCEWRVIVFHDVAFVYVIVLGFHQNNLMNC